jgi:electron transport complex protein RnfE
MKNNKLSILLKGLILENPVLVLVLGTCPTLAQTGNVINALSMGIAATIVLVCSNMAISALRKIIPDSVRIPCYIVVIAAFVTVVQMAMEAWLPELFKMMGVYLALIVVNCIILGRAEMFARKNSVVDSALDGLGMGLGFLLALLAMATVREVLGAGSFAGLEIPVLKDYNLPILQAAPGGFLVFGILIAIVNKIGPKKGEGKRKQYSCEGCPSAALCGKVSCSENVELVVNTEPDTGENNKEEEAGA